MTFDEVLAGVLDLLQRQGRVSYRSLTQQYAWADAYLEDLKEEIIYAKPLANERCATTSSGVPPSTWASAASAWGSQKAMSMVR